MRILLFSVCFFVLATPALLANTHDFTDIPNPNQAGVESEQRAPKANQVAELKRAIELARAKMRVKQLGNAPDKVASIREGNAEIKQLENALELARAEARVERLENAPIGAAKSSQQPASKQDAVASSTPQSAEPSFWKTKEGITVLLVLAGYFIIPVLLIL